MNLSLQKKKKSLQIFPSKSTCSELYHTIVQSHLNYLTITYGVTKSNALKSLQTMQYRAMKTVFKLPIRFSTHQLYREVCKSILPVHGLYKHQLLLYMFKVIYKFAYHIINFVQNQTSFDKSEEVFTR